MELHLDIAGVPGSPAPLSLAEAARELSSLQFWGESLLLWLAKIYFAVFITRRLFAFICCPQFVAVFVPHSMLLFLLPRVFLQFLLPAVSFAVSLPIVCLLVLLLTVSFAVFVIQSIFVFFDTHN